MKKLILALLITASPAFAQAPAATEPPAPGAAVTPPAAKAKPLGVPEKKFIKDSLEGMFFVMELIGKTKTGAKVEVTKTESGALKADLDKVWAEVAGVASTNNEKIPTELAGGD